MSDLFIKAGFIAIVIAGVLVWRARRRERVSLGRVPAPVNHRLHTLIQGISASIGGRT